MSDPISIVQAVGVLGGGFSIGRSLWDFLGFVRSVAGADMVAAYFSHDGTRLHGSDKVDVERYVPPNQETVWWFYCKDAPDYVYVRFPVGGAVEELLGNKVGEKNPDSRFWRWAQPARSGTIVGTTDPPNVKVEFVVVGYRPKALIRHFSTESK